MKEAATPNIVVLKTNKPASPLKAAHNPLVDELKAALERRKAVVGNWKLSQPKQEETSVERPPIRALSNAGR
ncbi:hypothetical protein BC629DRAFT_1543287 [Irpex lacteus]|nr:hypothetical protein BC629DRAFT_1543287 [Irpex lacteus]